MGLCSTARQGYREEATAGIHSGTRISIFHQPCIYTHTLLYKDLVLDVAVTFRILLVRCSCVHRDSLLSGFIKLVCQLGYLKHFNFLDDVNGKSRWALCMSLVDNQRHGFK